MRLSENHEAAQRVADRAAQRAADRAEWQTLVHALCDTWSPREVNKLLNAILTYEK